LNPILSVVIIATIVADVADEGDGVCQGVAAEITTDEKGLNGRARMGLSVESDLVRCHHRRDCCGHG
jgi:hypothetical protein